MKRILVIEDDKILRRNIVGLLGNEGYAVSEAGDGLSGLKAAQELTPDLVICDIIMPEVDGYEVLARLRQNETTATVPFIFMTALGDKADMRQGMEAGADDYISKPYSRSELLAAVASQLAKKSSIDRHYQKNLDKLRKSLALALPHEFITPLSNILSYSELILEDPAAVETAELTKMVGRINNSARRLQRLIGNFLLYAELEATLTNLEKISKWRTGSTLSTALVITNLAKLKAQQARREKDLALNLQDAPVQIGEEWLNKLLTELVDNAFNYSAAGTPVQVGSVREDEWLEISVRNTGRGMTAEQIGAIGAYMQFEREFYEQQGTGLGLIIAKRLTELHGGTFHLQSTPGQQTIVKVTLPVAGSEN